MSVRGKSGAQVVGGSATALLSSALAALLVNLSGVALLVARHLGVVGRSADLFIGGETCLMVDSAHAMMVDGLNALLVAPGLGIVGKSAAEVI